MPSLFSILYKFLYIIDIASFSTYFNIGRVHKNLIFQNSSPSSNFTRFTFPWCVIIFVSPYWGNSVIFAFPSHTTTAKLPFGFVTSNSNFIVSTSILSSCNFTRDSSYGIIIVANRLEGILVCFIYLHYY